MVKQRADMVRGSIPLCLPLLRHDITDVNFQGTGLPDGLHDAIHQQVGDDAGIQASGPQDDQIRMVDGVDALFQGLRMLRYQPHPGDPAVLPLLAVEDFGLPQHPGPVFKFCLPLHVCGGHWQHGASDGKDLTHAAHRLVEAARNTVEGG